MPSPTASKAAAFVTSEVDTDHNGAITAASPTVFTNSLPQAFVFALCVCAGNNGSIPPHTGVVAVGSSSVFVNGSPAARIDDTTICKNGDVPPGTIKTGSEDVFIGG
jgi:hypothetical protein